ncbi:invasion associated locus B family protein [Ruegeria atlantica]|uniref:invasion associated locus B family protein n=1 Tax=Ruegeria atlantica TaxID=81569 RepID=UPI0024957729|nr:invasion associated locus B family protein [Ruegeria atlantica]
MNWARALLFGACLYLAGASHAQDLQGRDTAGNWRVTHYSSHGIWNAICDEREEDGALKQRCYIRWVDVYALAPQFGALFTFVTPRDGTPLGHHDVMFGPERGTAFLPDGFIVTKDGKTIWQLQERRCLLWADCELTGVQSASVLKAMLSGTAMEFAFVDRDNRRFDLEWSLEGFAEAYAAYEKQWALRQ